MPAGRKGREKEKKKENYTATLVSSREGADGSSCQQLGPSRSKYNIGVLIATNPKKNSLLSLLPKKSRASVLFCFIHTTTLSSLCMLLLHSASCSNLLFSFWEQTSDPSQTRYVHNFISCYIKCHRIQNKTGTSVTSWACTSRHFLSGRGQSADIECCQKSKRQQNCGITAGSGRVGNLLFLVFPLWKCQTGKTGQSETGCCTALKRLGASTGTRSSTTTTRHLFVFPFCFSRI